MALSEEEQWIVQAVRDWVDRDVRPQVQQLEHANEYPEKLIEQMKEMGIYGLAIPEPWGHAHSAPLRSRWGQPCPRQCHYRAWGPCNAPLLH